MTFKDFCIQQFHRQVDSYRCKLQAMLDEVEKYEYWLDAEWPQRKATILHAMREVKPIAWEKFEGQTSVEIYNLVKKPEWNNILAEYTSQI